MCVGNRLLCPSKPLSTRLLGVLLKITCKLTLGKHIQFLDGRFKIAKTYTLIVQTDDLLDEVLPDWTGFIDTHRMKEVFFGFKKHVDYFVSSVMAVSS